MVERAGEVRRCAASSNESGIYAFTRPGSGRLIYETYPTGAVDSGGKPKID